MRGFLFKWNPSEKRFVLLLGILYLSYKLIWKGDPLRGISGRKHIAKLFSGVQASDEEVGAYYNNCNNDDDNNYKYNSNNDNNNSNNVIKIIDNDTTSNNNNDDSNTEEVGAEVVEGQPQALLSSVEETQTQRPFHLEQFKTYMWNTSSPGAFVFWPLGLGLLDSAQLHVVRGGLALRAVRRGEADLLLVQ